MSISSSKGNSNLIEIHRFYPNKCTGGPRITSKVSTLPGELKLSLSWKLDLILVGICDCLTLQIAITYMIHSVWLTSIYESSHHNSTKDYQVKKKKNHFAADK